MTKVFSIAIKEKTAHELKYSLYFGEIRQIVLKTLFQSHSITKDREEAVMLDGFSDTTYRQISMDSNIQEFLVREIIEKFLFQFNYFRRFWKSSHIQWSHRQNRIYSKVRIYLHKVYKLAPVFDYSRAKTNLKILQRFFQISSFWPRISTQLAMVIYLTDLKDKLSKKKLLMQNIRVLIDCSAYAFYRTKNIMIEKGVLKQNE
ncbi:MAG: hypothetical protein EU542_07955 [Promethearchaeota archaeon]|nr:MAG: hypothetical protein EU542_07955 [Candidatus Lokiarchaeota archaeon]